MCKVFSCISKFNSNYSNFGLFYQKSFKRLTVLICKKPIQERSVLRKTNLKFTSIKAKTRKQIMLLKLIKSFLKGISKFLVWMKCRLNTD